MDTPPKRGASPADWLTARRFAAILAGVIAIVFWDVLLCSHTLFYRDYAFFSLPNAVFFQRSMFAGEWPLWNDLSHCGIPFLAQWNTLTCYPPYIVACLFPLPWALGFFCLAHLLMGGIAMRSLALRWTDDGLAAAIAGIAFAFNGMMMNSLMWPSFMTVWAWTPLVLLHTPEAWRKGGRAIPCAALIGALHMLGGNPEIILLTWGVLLILFITDAPKDRRDFFIRARRLGSVVLLVAAIAAVQLLPFLQLAQHSHRETGYAEGHWAMPVLGIANFLTPLFRTTPGILGGVHSQYDQQFTSSYYFGIGVALLALAAPFLLRDRRIKALGALAILFIWLSMGDAGGLYPALRKLFPPLGMARYPVKFLQGCVILTPLLAASAFHFLRTRSAQRSPSWRKRLAPAALAALPIGLTIWMARVAPDRAEDWSVTAVSGLSRLAILAASCALLPLAARHGNRRCLMAAQGGCLALLLLDLLTHTPPQNPTVVSWAYSPEAAQHDLKPPPGYRAMVAPLHRAVLNEVATPDALGYCLGQRQALSHNWNILDRIPKIDGFYSLQLAPQRDIWSRLYDSPSPPPDGLLDFLGASQISHPESLFKWTRREQAMPLATVGQQPEFATSAADAARRVVSPDFDFRRHVVLEAAAANAVPEIAPDSATIEWWRRTSSRELEVQVVATAPSLLVIAQAHHTPWKASIDGTETDILQANRAFQAIVVPPGRRHIRFVYRDNLFLAGLCLSVAASGCCAFWLIAGRRFALSPPGPGRESLPG